jgi:SAM-dependent methyltransferase
MLVSVIVPTHAPRFLAETIRSVLDQTESEFEILVVPNGGAKLDGVLPEDRRIRILPFDGPALVGAVKQFAFEAARGDLLVELDHDDLLAPQALQRVKEALAGGRAEFAYSNFAELDFESGEAVTYNSYWGWASRPAVVRGRSVTEMIAFDPSPASIGYVWYAPNHVRAWTREGYQRAGGHDPSMSICDDHDLMIRTYLTGRMVRIDECLYLQRNHPNRTTLIRNDEIQVKTQELYARSIESLVVRWAALRGLPCFDLGGAHNGAPGWVTVDRQGARVLADLRGRWPWEHSTVGAFRAQDLLEHLPDKQHTMEEIHRCLVPGGWILSSTPSALGQGAFMDPTHCSYWVRNSFYYWTDEAFARFIGNSSIRFQVQRLEEIFPSDWHRAQNIPYVNFDGICLKDGYDGPGAHQI